jgi:uncharacterized protein YndB with AHSA1/START domain
MNEPKFVYVTYIATTPEALWRALTDAAFTRQYWFGTTVESDWTPGSRVVFRSDGELHDAGEVLECEPHRRLSYSWHVEFHEVFRREKPSRVTFELEPVSSDKGAAVKLTVTHDDFEPGSKVLAAVRNGWPMILASLKSLLETGHALAATSAQAARSAREKAIARAQSDAA